MKIITDTKSIYSLQIKIVILTCLITVIPYASVLLFVRLKTNIPIDSLIRDTSSIADIPPYIGLFSNIGLLIWSSCAAICIFSYVMLKKVSPNKALTSFLLYSGLLNSLLVLDDFFMFHEFVFPNYLHIAEHIVYLLYVVFASLIFVKYRKVIQKTEYIILFSAVACFGISITIDKIPYYVPIAIEDTFKLIGIITWTTYFIRLCSQEIKTYVLARN